MKHLHLFSRFFLALVILATITTPAMSQAAVPLLINYQGLLSGRETGEPLEGTHDLVFRIYNDPVDTDPSALVWEETHAGVKVADGVFSVILGSTSALSATDFSEPNRWLEMEVSGETLTPRQRMTSVAYSIISEDSRLLGGNAASDFADALHTHSGMDITSGTVPEGRIDETIARDTEVDSKITSHAGMADAHHVKTTSFSELTGTLTEAQIPPAIARDSEVSSEISVHEGVVDAHHPRYTDTEAVVAMGAKANANPLNHDRTSSFSELAGTLSEAQIPPTIARTAQIMPTVLANDGPGSALNADVLDGVDSTGFAAVGHAHPGEFWRLGGNSGTSPGTDFVGTRDNQAVELRVNNSRALRLEPASSPNLIGGHGANMADAGVVGASIGGGGGAGLGNRVTDNFGTVGGGWNNQAGDAAGTTDDRTSATVAGGVGNLADGAFATVGGGSMNRAQGDYSTIAGGGPSDPAILATRNRVTDDYGTVGGGGDNQAGDDAGTTDDATYATVGGGASNTASADVSTVGGGYMNTASSLNATVAGGNSNIASGAGATVGGGYSNTASETYATIGGGDSNEASATSATVGGGNGNTAAALAATVPGGDGNQALGPYSFAGGRRAIAHHRGSFVWGDSQDEDIHSIFEDEVTFRCRGGVAFTSGSSGDNQEVWWGPGFSGWVFSSDRNLKENFVELESKEVLERVSRLPITEWNFKGYAVRHIGPVAQDFHALFPLGGSDTKIDSGDLQGVSLAAIQGLHKIAREKDARISMLEERNAELESRVAALEALVQELARKRKGGDE